VFFSGKLVLNQSGTSATLQKSLHFTSVVDDTKYMVVTAICVSVCLSVPHGTPTLLHGLRRNLAEW